MFKDGEYKHASGIIIKVVKGVPYLKGNNLPLTVRTQDIFNMEKWEVIK